LEDCCSGEWCYQMCWIWNRYTDPESHVLQWGNFFERDGLNESVNLVYMAILSLVNTIKQGQISQYNDSSYTNTSSIMITDIIHAAAEEAALPNASSNLLKFPIWTILSKNHAFVQLLSAMKLLLWISPSMQSTIHMSQLTMSLCGTILSLSCKNPTCIKMTSNGKLLKLMLHSLVWIKLMSWFLITTYLHFRYDVAK